MPTSPIPASEFNRRLGKRTDLYDAVDGRRLELRDANNLEQMGAYPGMVAGLGALGGALGGAGGAYLGGKAGDTGAGVMVGAGAGVAGGIAAGLLLTLLRRRRRGYYPAQSGPAVGKVRRPSVEVEQDDDLAVGMAGRGITDPSRSLARQYGGPNG